MLRWKQMSTAAALLTKSCAFLLSPKRRDCAPKKAAALLKERRGERAVLLATHDREAIRELGWRVIDLT